MASISRTGKPDVLSPAQVSETFTTYGYAIMHNRLYYNISVRWWWRSLCIIKCCIHACLVSATHCISWPLHSNCCHYGSRQKVLSETYIFSHMHGWNWKLPLTSCKALSRASHERPVWWTRGSGWGAGGGEVMYALWPKDWKQRPLSFRNKRNVFWCGPKLLPSFTRSDLLMRCNRWRGTGSQDEAVLLCLIPQSFHKYCSWLLEHLSLLKDHIKWMKLLVIDTHWNYSWLHR